MNKNKQGFKLSYIALCLAGLSIAHSQVALSEEAQESDTQGKSTVERVTVVGSRQAYSR